MSSANQINIMLLAESWYNLLTKGEAHSSVIFSPSLDIFVWVRPKQVTEKTSVWNISRSHYSLDLIQSWKFWRETSMHTKNLFINDCSNRETIETVSEGLPEFYVIPSLTFIIEAIDSVNWCTFMITSQKEEVLRILYLISKEKTNSFQRLFTSIYIISKEEIVGIRRESSIFKESQQIIVLTMNITANFDGCF